MLRPILLLLAALALAPPAMAQQGAPKPPAVGVVKVERKPVLQSHQYVGRVQGTERVSLVARVTAFLDQRLFTEGAEVKKGDLLYRLEQGPFEADVRAKQAAIAQVKAQLQNANVTLSRARALLHTPAGQQSAVDTALASQQSFEAQLLAAQAQLQQSEINLSYTEIHAPIDGKIGRSTVTVGNVVSPTTGTLATIVSQDPMYVVFPVPVRDVIDLRHRDADRGGLNSVVVKLQLPDGKFYDKTGKLDFVDNTVSATTDTMTLRGVIANPPLAAAQNGEGPTRELVDNELVTVVLEDAQPTEALTLPRAAVLTDQEGDYVYLVGSDNKVHQQRITLGRSTPTTAVVASGLQEGQTVILDGLQKVRPGETVSPAAVTSGPASSSLGRAGALDMPAGRAPSHS